MSAGALHSDHINYLILRYLQESGHENAATAFFKDWHRPRDHRDPESLPFAHTVGRNELISVIQEGLRFDELISNVGREQRRFQWTLNHDSLENGTGGSRPSSSGKRKSRPLSVRAPDDFPTPAPKRLRRSEPPETAQVNGDRDTMDVDQPSASPEAEDDGDAASPAAGSDAEAAEPKRFDSVASQTPYKVRPKMSAMYWKVDKPGATVLHSAWWPDPKSKNANVLLTVGNSLCRLYEVPHIQDDVQQISHTDYPYLSDRYVVTATAWHPDGRTATCAVDHINETPDGRIIPEQKIINHSGDYGSCAYGDGPKLMKAPGIILGLKYSPNGNYLLVAKTNLKRGSVQIWETPKHASDEYLLPEQPVAWRLFEHQILDASWVGDESFLVSGQEGLSSLYKMDPSKKTEGELTAETIAIQGLNEQRSRIVTRPERWDKVRYDQRLNVVAFVSTEARKLLTMPLTVDGAPDRKDADAVVELPGDLTAIAFQPSTDVIESSLLAATFENGSTIVYKVSCSTGDSVTCEKLAKLELAEEAPCLGLAWSPDGQQLAVCGTEVVQIWIHEDLVNPHLGSTKQAFLTWRPDASAFVSESNGESNGEMNGEESEEVVEPSLSWSADGESLAFTVSRQLAVIRFQPSFSALAPTWAKAARDAEVKTNGNQSPSS